MTRDSITKGRSIPIAGLAVIAALMSFAFGGAARLDANQGAHTPDMTGVWVFESGESCGFTNVWDLNETAACGEVPVGAQFTITVQHGRAFAGSFPDLPGSKITGVIGDDGTFLMQGWVGNNRLFYSGQLSFKGHVLRMTGTGNELEDWLATMPSMSSLWFTARKVD